MRLVAGFLFTLVLTTGLATASAETPSTGRPALARSIKSAIAADRRMSGSEAMTRGARRVLWKKLGATGDTKGDFAMFALGAASSAAVQRTGTHGGKVTAADMEIGIDTAREQIARSTKR